MWLKTNSAKYNNPNAICYKFGCGFVGFVVCVVE